MSPGGYGIKEIKYDENGKIIDLILEPGAEIDSDTSGKRNIIGSKENNLSFEQLEQLTRERYREEHKDKEW